MSSKLPEKITHKIETICKQGCFQVNQLLERARTGIEIEELSEFSPSEARQIIKELEQIMAVYIDCEPPNENDNPAD
jgi:hypothetical protein